ncbi:hypothetical protein AVEN_253587-1 [Araneus ventricosus]|uniref:Uncharacterized protein n=1 Tax=Araneus ventricosus TaxID=182803 RepID=A0A4Y2CBR5_ARAVE|nr:hypothetical protein AVEN_253587-1 [Araneus ventricosus]
MQGNPWMKDFSEDRPDIPLTGLGKSEHAANNKWLIRLIPKSKRKFPSTIANEDIWYILTYLEPHHACTGSYKVVSPAFLYSRALENVCAVLSSSNFAKSLTISVAHAKLKKVYGKDCMSRTRVLELFRSLQHGLQNVNVKIYDFQNLDECRNI